MRIGSTSPAVRKTGTASLSGIGDETGETIPGE
jgi:hypothetical protein